MTLIPKPMGLDEFPNRNAEDCFRDGVREWDPNRVQSLSFFLEGLKFNPDHIGCNYNAGLIYWYYYKEPAMAVKYFEKATTNVVACKCLAEWHEEKKDLENASQFHQMAANLQDLDSIVWMMNWKKEKDDPIDAAHWARKIPNTHEKYHEARLIIADYEISEKNYRKAQSILESIPVGGEMLHKLGRLHIDHGIAADSKYLGLKCMEAAADDDHQPSIRYLAQHNYKEGYYPAAKRWYELLDKMTDEEVDRLVVCRRVLNHLPNEETEERKSPHPDEKVLFEFYRICNKIRKMANSGDSHAQLLMGMIYGKAGENLIASEWFDKSCGYEMPGLANIELEDVD